MTGRERERGSLESLLISVAVHLAVILLVPYVEQPVLDVYPLDIAGVIEIATIEAAPAAAAPAPGVAVQEVTPEPKPQAPEPAKPAPKAEPKVEPKAEPKAQPKVEPKVAAAPEPARQEPPKQEKPEVVTSPAGRTPSPVTAKDPPESKLPEPKPTPEPTPEPVPEHTPAPAAEPQATQVARATGQPGVGQPDGAGIIPRPEYPGDDPTGSAMIRLGAGDDHGVWIPKDVQNLECRGEALVRIRVRADGSIDTLSFVEPPPDSAMIQPIRTAISTVWQFRKDSTPGRADSYYIDVRVGYDGGTEDVWIKSERASYIR